MHPLIDNAERALAEGDAGRAVALAGRALSGGAPRLAAWHIVSDGLATVLRRTGLLGPGFQRGALRPSELRENPSNWPSAWAVRDLVEELQRALHALVQEGETRAAQQIFELGEAVSEIECDRAPPNGSPSGRVVSLLCCERPELLDRTLADLLASDLPASDLVLFEDASRDPGVLDRLRQLDGGAHRLHLLVNRGFSSRSWAGNHNVVLDYVERELAGFETLILLDTDMALARDWWSCTQSLYRALRDRQLSEGRLGVITAFHAEPSHPTLRTIHCDGVAARIKTTVGGCQLVVPRETYLDALGPFDHLADWGWCARLRAAGRYAACVVPSRAQHLGDDSLLFHCVHDHAGDFLR
ncbi:MAG: hypothetical protein JSV80_15800 [Acidobacteriota bacterium]|nr:MAG: hypothetical protein JSV80_15800 [Acidobacteriota bacterium]